VVLSSISDTSTGVLSISLSLSPHCEESERDETGAISAAAIDLFISWFAHRTAQRTKGARLYTYKRDGANKHKQKYLRIKKKKGLLFSNKVKQGGDGIAWHGGDNDKRKKRAGRHKRIAFTAQLDGAKK